MKLLIRTPLAPGAALPVGAAAVATGLPDAPAGADWPRHPVTNLLTVNLPRPDVRTANIPID